MHYYAQTGRFRPLFTWLYDKFNTPSSTKHTIPIEDHSQRSRGPSFFLIYQNQWSDKHAQSKSSSCWQKFVFAHVWFQILKRLPTIVKTCLEIEWLLGKCMFSLLNVKKKYKKKGHAHDICIFFYLVCNYNYPLDFICYI